MSIALLLEKYDVSTEEGLQKALNEIEKEEADVDEALTNALSKACILEGRLRTASQAYTKLGEVKNDAQVAADMVNKTAALARDVSAKVRQLDLARSRVAECQQRVHDLIDLKVCSAGVDAAIKAHDYETAAAHIARFLSMEPASVAAARARGDADPRHDITAAANTLKECLVKKFNEAAKKEDNAAVERLFKLFPQIGCTELGVDLLAKFLATQLEATLRRVGAVSAGGASGEGGAGEAAHADALTRVLEAGAAALERVRRLAAAPHTLPRALAHLQPVISAGARSVCTSLLASVRARGGAGAGRGERAERGERARGAREVEPALEELALVHSRVQLYFTFLRRRLEQNTSMDEATKAACAEEVEKMIAECELTRTAQHLLDQYLALERFYLEESVTTALKLSAPQPGATSSSLVDDVFFIVRKVIRRGLSTGSVEGVCCTVNEAGAALERAAAALRRRLGAPPPDPLSLPPPPAPAPPPAAPPSRDLAAQRALLMSHITEAAQGASWAEVVAREAERAGRGLARTEPERRKLQPCAAGLAAAAAAFRAVHAAGLAAIRAAMQPALCAWADFLVAPDLDFEEAEEQASAVSLALDALAECAQAQLSGAPGAADALLADLGADLAKRARERMLTHTYTRESGLSVERRCRRLASWAGSAAGGARAQAGRLARAAALLALDAPAHAAQLPPAARLPPADAAAVLARRSDFKLEDIKRLKL